MARVKRRRRARSVRAWAEALEQRLALAIFTVDNVNDSGAGSLREAILNANAVNSEDTIVFDGAVFSAPQTIEVINALPQFGGASGGLSIVGPGLALLTVRKNGAGPMVTRRVFDSFSPRLSLSGMTVTGGNVSANGGGLSVAGINPDVLLEEVVFTGNSANSNDGGAVFLNNNATLTAFNCTFFNNTARLGGGIMFFDGGSLFMENCAVGGNVTGGASGNDVSGGGIYFAGAALATPPEGFVPGALVIRNSEVNRNVAFRDGGGIGLENFTGVLLLQNCTVTTNSANDSGGGIAAEAGAGTLRVQNCTVTNNSAHGTAATSGGGGIFRSSPRNNVLTVDNSIVSGNTHAAVPDILTDSFTTTNLNASAVGSAAGFTASAESANNLPFGANLMLGPLQNNGGRTQTHALLPGSPAINAGSNARVPAELTTDQRGPGFARVVGPAVDIGAYERGEPPRVTGVFVRGQAWSLPFRQFIENRGLGESALGFAVPAAADQLKTLPWANIDQVSIRFSQDVTLTHGNFSAGGITVANYAVASQAYEPVTHTAVWTLAQPLRNDRVTLALNAAAVMAAGASLDGDWADGTHPFPSGDGTAGGDFRFRINALPGDVDRSGSVLANDFSEVKKRFFTTPASPGSGDALYSIFHDVNGSASVLADDFSEVKKRFFNTLPA